MKPRERGTLAKRMLLIPWKTKTVTFIYVSMLYISVINMCEHRHGFCHYHGGGLIQLLILRILHEKPSHGYQIMDELEKITSEKYIPEPGAVYTILRRMEDRGLVVSKWEKKSSGANRRVYTLTDAGVKTLKEGLGMVKKRRQLMDSLIKFYDTHFVENRKGGEK